VLQNVKRIHQHHSYSEFLCCRHALLEVTVRIPELLFVEMFSLFSVYFLPLPSIPPPNNGYEVPMGSAIAPPAGLGGARPPNAFMCNSQPKICTSVKSFTHVHKTPIQQQQIFWLELAPVLVVPGTLPTLRTLLLRARLTAHTDARTGRKPHASAAHGIASDGTEHQN